MRPLQKTTNNQNLLNYSNLQKKFTYFMLFYSQQKFVAYHA